MNRSLTFLSKIITGILSYCLCMPGLGSTCGSFFFAPILSEAVRAKLTLSAHSSGYARPGSEQFEILASPGQRIFVCGSSSVEAGAVPLVSAEGVTTYEMTSEQAWFDFYGMVPPCAGEKTFQTQPVASDQHFVLRWHRKHNSIPQNISSWGREARASYGGNAGGSVFDDVFKPGRPGFFPTGDGSTAVFHIFPAFLKSFSLFQQDTSGTDYDYLIIVIQNPGGPSIRVRITRQQFRVYLDDYARSGQWHSLLGWLRGNLNSRSVLINHLLDTLAVFADTDSLLLSNPGVFQAMINQLQGILESPEHVFVLELELEWLNQSLAQIEVPGNNQQEKKTTQVSNSHTSASTMVPVATTLPVHQAANTMSSGNRGGSPPNPTLHHSYSQQPCLVCNLAYCRLKQPEEAREKREQTASSPRRPARGQAQVHLREVPGSSAAQLPAEAMAVDESPATRVYLNLIGLLNCYAREGVIVRVIKNAETSVTAMITGGSASATYLFPGCRMLTLANYPGIILSPEISMVALFKLNVYTNRVRSQSLLLSSLPSALQPIIQITGAFSDCIDYNTLTKIRSLRNSFYKNHINFFSLVLKSMEQTLFSDRQYILDPAQTTTSGHIRADGGIAPGKIRSARCEPSSLGNNEVIINWDNWQDKLLGFFIHDFNTESVNSLRKLIVALISAQTQHPQSIMALPVLLYDSHQASFTFISSVQTLIPEHFHPRPGKPDVVDLLNPDAFPFNINHMALMLQERSSQHRLPVLFSFQPNNSYLLSVLKTSLYRQYLEHKGIVFSEEEALVLAFASIARTTTPELPVWFQELLINNGVSLSVVQDITMALARLHGVDAQNPDNITGEADDSPAPAENRQELYLHLLKFGSGHCIPMPETLLATIHEDNQSEVIAIQKSIKYTIDSTTFATIKLNKGHGWPLLLSELRMSIPCATVDQLRQAGFSSQIPARPYAEMMASIPGNLNLLDQLEALYSPDYSPFVKGLLEHFRKSGFPCYPGTLRAGGEVTTQARDTLKTELAKRPTEAQINAIKSNYRVQSRQWESSEYPLWHHDPFAGMEQVEDWQPPMVGQKGKTCFNGISQGVSNHRSVNRPVTMVETSWQCSICMSHTAQESVVELECKHYIHDSCLESLLQHAAAKLCPVCRKPLTPFQFGNQPPGTMSWEVTDETCPGENTRETIQITYEMPEGSINVSGQPVMYPGDTRFAYLPNHRKGRKALAMLKDAFERGLVFTVGHSLSRNIDNVIVWNDIPHKTSLKHCLSGHSYPDPGYVDRLIDELKQRNIPEPE